ncbi:MAG: hypothetical protein KF722_00945 [Nitrospira sp.]|nr:hypothetical protein [Nitrospira sp.]
MNSKDIVLLVMDEYGGSMSGKTLLQKVCYFAEVALNMGVPFKAHHYGPYSPTIEESVGELKELGFIEEHTVGFGVSNPSGFGELRRYDYRLTDDGRKVVEDLKSKKRVEAKSISGLVERIKKSGNPDYFELSIAAKSYFILRKQNKPMTNSEIEKEAQKLGWPLQEGSVQKAIHLLQGLKLVTSN